MKGCSAINNIVIQDRKSVSLSGVEDVISFDDVSVVMRTTLGMLSIDGNGLRIVKLNVDEGEVSVEGEFNGMFYIDENAKQPGKIRGKLFK